MHQCTNVLYRYIDASIHQCLDKLNVSILSICQYIYESTYWCIDKSMYWHIYTSMHWYINHWYVNVSIHRCDDASMCQHIAAIDASTYQYTNELIYWCINVSIHQCIDDHWCINISMQLIHQCIDVLMHQCIDVLMHRCIDLMMYQYIDADTSMNWRINTLHRFCILTLRIGFPQSGA